MELLVVTAIIGILTSITIVSYSQSRTDRQLEVAGREVAGALRDIQNAALAGKKDGVNPSRAICRHRLDMTSGSSAYRWNYQYKDNSNPPVCALTGNMTAPMQLKDGVQFSGGLTWVSFGLPHAALDSSAGVNGGAIVLRKATRNYYVCACPSGDIKESRTACSC